MGWSAHFCGDMNAVAEYYQSSSPGWLAGLLLHSSAGTSPDHWPCHWQAGLGQAEMWHGPVTSWDVVVMTTLAMWCGPEQLEVSELVWLGMYACLTMSHCPGQRQIDTVREYMGSCHHEKTNPGLRWRQWPVTYLMMLSVSDWTMSCHPGRQVVVTVSEQRWKYRWAAYKSFDETGKFNIL